jgi:hypothetical protein
MVDPPLAPARLSNHRAMHMEDHVFTPADLCPTGNAPVPAPGATTTTTSPPAATPVSASPLAHHGLGGCVSAFRRICRAYSSSVSRAMAIPSLSVFTITGRPICWAAALMARVYMTSVS